MCAPVPLCCHSVDLPLTLAMFHTYHQESIDVGGALKVLAKAQRPSLLTVRQYDTAEQPGSGGRRTEAATDGSAAGTVKAAGVRGRGSQSDVELDGCIEASAVAVPMGDGRTRSGGGLPQQERVRLVVVSLNPYWAKVAYEGGGGTGCGR